MSMPRPEHPRPQFQRPAWINLNGPWTFTFDPGRSGRERGLADSRGFDREILVPFCPESQLSGVGHTDFIEAMWYHRRIEIPADWAGRNVLLHVGGVDYEAEAYVDGRSAGVHYGGTVSFAMDITALVEPGGTHDLVLRVHDDTRSGRQPGGKQSQAYDSHGCFYTRTTGIWQTVWLEAMDPRGLADVHIVPDLDGGRLLITPTFRRTDRKGLSFRATARSGEADVARAAVSATQGGTLELQLVDPVAWRPGQAHLYDLTLEVLNGETVIDRVGSYAGLRKVHIEGNRIYLNNRPLFFRSVLDQGFYPDGLWTAPSDEALRGDIERSMAAGFNGARLHQKVFEERFHYWADRLGYLTWAESSSWGGVPSDVTYSYSFLNEWREIVRRSRNHPSIIAWTPFNETCDIPDLPTHHRTQIAAYDICKDLDPTRPVNDASGYVHSHTDIFTVHTYAQDPEALRADLTPTDTRPVWQNDPDRDAPYAGQPYIVDEYGGVKWNPADAGRTEGSWGYGETPRSLDEFYDRIAALTDVLLGLEHISGYTYTQLTDIEQEQNGVYFYDRSQKFDMARIRGVFSRKPNWAEI
jgi:beta-galactosidase/beta-glucuronidase